MAGKSLGTLTLDLIARTAGFASGMSQAERSSAKWRKKIVADVDAVATAFAAASSAAVATAAGVGAYGFNLLKSSSSQIAEAKRLSDALGMSTQALLSWQYAAGKAGVSGEQIADIFKDLGDKIGDAALNKSGEAVDALDALGLSAEKLKRVSPDEQLLAISDALKKIGTTSEKTTILESLGNDLSRMLPLLEQGGEKLRQYMAAAQTFGVAPDDADIEKLVRTNALFEDMASQVDGVKIALATGLADVDLSGVQNAITEIGETLRDPQVLQGLTNLVQGAADLAGWLIKVAAAAGNIAALTRQGIAQNAGGALKTEASAADIRARIAELEKQQQENVYPVKRWMNAAGRMLQRKDGSPEDELALLKGRLPLAEKLDSEVRAPVTLPPPETEKKVSAVRDIPHGTDFLLPPGGSNGKTGDSTAQKVLNSFRQMETAYQRLIALTDASGERTREVTELEKLRFELTSGKLTSLNDTQKTRLTQLATELDLLNAQKKAMEEQKQLQAFTASQQVQTRNAQDMLDTELVGAGTGEQTRSRMRELLEIRRSYYDQMESLRQRQESGDISRTLYEGETAVLKAELEKRLRMQQDYYRQLDALNDDWLSGAGDALKDYVTEADNNAAMAKSSVTSVLGTTENSVSAMLDDIIRGTKSAGDAVKDVVEDLGNAIITELENIAAKKIVAGLFGGLAGESNIAGSGDLLSLLTGAGSNGDSSAGSAVAGATSSLTDSDMLSGLKAVLNTSLTEVFSALPDTLSGLFSSLTDELGSLLSSLGSSLSGILSGLSGSGGGFLSLLGMAHDGIDSVPATGTWLLEKGERVISGRTSKKLDATLSAVHSAAGNRSGGQSFSYSPVINVNGDPDARTLKMLEQAVQQGAKRGYQMVAESLSTGSGAVHSAVNTRYARRRSN
ncbi:phage tail tape measure protein [Escherichia coli]|uniref:phage tail tape measure protein n=1 Tax=Escherichia coli TaxID=562 RepID=UPI0012FD1A9D|nr:phage tail tape measure protein [Escherichia coli]MVW25241.1 phage tail tape measure protein [Escherichia coli]